MKIIGWDTSTKSGSIVALEVGNTPGASPYTVLSDWTLSVDAGQHSERLLWGIHQVLESCRWKLEDVDAFGVGIGPGSFTGLRIGLTTAKTLAWVMKKPILPVSSLLAIGRSTAEVLALSEENPLVIVTQDAAKGEFFALWGLASSLLDCVVKAEGDLPGHWKRGVEEVVITPEKLEKELSKRLKGGVPWIALGEGRNRYPEFWKSLPKKQERLLYNPSLHSPSGASLAQLFWQAAQLELGRSPHSISPRYLRESDAERKLKAGLLGKK
jgi:tRNA threonylcarbamoyladenosine biosynthesis protein TsaB